MPMVRDGALRVMLASRSLAFIYQERWHRRATTSGDIHQRGGGKARQTAINIVAIPGERGGIHNAVGNHQLTIYQAGIAFAGHCYALLHHKWFAERSLQRL